ncbi:MAG: hypothetical protein ACR2G5_11785 [Pyrinomonadaceae bacterium]
MLWILGAGFIVLWFLLKVLMHKGGFVHILLLSGISLLIIQFAAYRKSRYQRISAGL